MGETKRANLVQWNCIICMLWQARPSQSAVRIYRPIGSKLVNEPKGRMSNRIVLWPVEARLANVSRPSSAADSSVNCSLAPGYRIAIPRAALWQYRFIQ